MDTPLTRFRNYQKLRANFAARTIIPTYKGRDMDAFRASMRSIDMTEDYYRFMALNAEVDMPVQEGYIERVRRSREMAVVNAHSRELWRKEPNFLERIRMSLSELKALIP